MDSVVEYLLDTTGELLKEEIKVLLGVGDQVRDLDARLRRMNAFLRASEGKRDGHPVVEELLRQILVESLKAEDVLDDYVLAVQKQKRRNFALKVVHGIDHAKRLTDVSKEIDRIDNTIDAIYRDVETYGIEIKDGNIGKSDTELSKEVKRRRRDVELVDVLGFRGEETALLTKLVSGSSKLDYVSIVGMPGLGKTTLAKKMYNNHFVNEYFQRLAWVYVSEDYNTRDVIRGIIKSVMPATYQEEPLAGMNVEELRNMLYKQLKDQRYLVVLDDIWKPEMWDEVKGCFPDCGNQSRIMITSRKKEVAVAVSPGSPHFLRPRTDEEGWELFLKKVFRGESCPSDLKETGIDIVKRCRGLPLSIAVMAGLCAQDRSYRRWFKLKDHVSSYLTEDKVGVEILALSYRDLPRELKPCFLYFAAFPEDFEVPARQLMRLWIAEGFVKPIGDLTLEDVAEDNLQKLIDRSLVQEGRSRADGGVKTCRIHDALRDLCISESKKEMFLEAATKIDSSRPKESNQRRISLQCSAPRFILSKTCDFSHVRSILSFGSDDDDKLMKAHWKAVSEGKLLRVLDFGTNNINEVPDAAKELLLLKYLSINAPSLEEFPSSITILWNLVTLDMRATRVAVVVPDEIYELQKLRHLYLAGAVKLPKPRSEQLKVGWNLQTLSTVAPVDGTKMLVKNGLLASVTRLGLFGCQTANSSKQEDFQSHWNVLSDISQLQNLESLKLASEMGDAVIARYINPNVVPSGLTKMTLNNTRIGSRSLEMIGNLLRLRILKLLEDSIQPGMDNFVFSKGWFPQLRLLHMSKLKAPVWDLKGGAVPHLQRLVMRDCSFWSIGAGVLMELDELKEIEIIWPHPWFARMLKDIEANLKGDCRLVAYCAPPSSASLN